MAKSKTPKLPDIKRVIAELEALYERMSTLSNHITHTLNFGGWTDEAAELLDPQIRVKHLYEKLSLLDQSIDISRDNLTQDLEPFIKERVRQILEKDIASAESSLRQVNRVKNEAEAVYEKHKGLLSKKREYPTAPEKPPEKPAPKKAPKKLSEPVRKKAVADVARTYEKKQAASVKKVEKNIQKLFYNATHRVALKTTSIEYKGQLFKLADYPALNRIVQQEIKKLHGGILVEIRNGINASWAISTEKNSRIVDIRLKDTIKLPKKGLKTFYDTNAEALNKFLKRTDKGLNLSDRVWNLLEPFKSEMEQALGLGISKGQSALSLASDMKKYLNQPDKLFRRARNEEGKLVLSKAAREYHPGQGVYRSSYKNALRVTRTETNIAYRTADYERWQQLPFITGIEVKLSAAHPRFDICDHLQGEYPKDFKFTGWHPQCLCFQTPKMMSDAEYDKFEDQLLGLGEFDMDQVKTVEKPPAAFGQWVRKNQERIDGWKNKPYWYKDNSKYVPGSGKRVPSR